MKELQCETAFTIPLFGGIPIPESVAVSWIIIAALTVFAIAATRNLKVEKPGKFQMALESMLTMGNNFFEEILGEKGKCYIPYLMSVAMYLGVSNLIGMLGFKPPTKDMNVTAALALMSIVLIEYSGIRAKGTKRFIKSFAEPVAIIAPINVLEIFIRPVSLCMRLFGNVLGAFVVMKLIELLVPVIVPIPFSLYFDVFDGLIQTYVFVFLTALFMKESIE